MIRAGEVLLNEQVVDKPGQQVPRDGHLRVRPRPRYVSRGGLKLEAALETFAIDPTGRTCLDVGASTGGFTDCLLQRGAARVYAVDVGYGDFAWKLRQDERVVLLERTNIRHLHALPDGALADLAVIDASFIGLALVLPPTLALLQADGEIVALVKPQFEARQEDVGAGGIVRAARVHQQVLAKTVATAQTLNLAVAGLCSSPLTGATGNREFLLWLWPQSAGRPGLGTAAVQAAIQQALAQRA